MKCFRLLLSGLFLTFAMSNLPARSAVPPGSQASNMQALHRSGQTFLTWNEISGAGVVYKIYRANAPITNIAQATYLGQVDQNSSLNKRASDITGTNTYYKIQDNGAALSDATGLFVYTSVAGGNFYYAVTASDGSGENTTVTLGANSLSSPISETVGLPEPVLQDAAEGHYVHWVNFQDTPLLPAMANRPGVTYNFMCRNIKPHLVQILNVGLYGGTNDYTTKVDKIHSDEFKLAFDDPRPDLFAPEPTGQDDNINPLNICWYGYGENFAAGQTLTTGAVPNYLQRHMIYIVEWVKRKWPHVDPNRVYLTGSSFGGIGAIALGMAYPYVFAAIWANVPRFDMGEPEWDLEYDSPITNRYQTIWGTRQQNLSTPNLTGTYPAFAAISEGYDIYDRLDQVYVATQNPQVDFPVTIIGVGKQDSHVGWHEKPRFITAMNATHHQLYLYWENTGHKFKTVEFDSVYQRMQLLNYRRNQSYVAISNFSINDDPGVGDDLLPNGTVTGESQGTINGYASWEPASIVDTATEYRIKVYLRGPLMDAFPDLAGVQTATATLTPRRLQVFPRIPDGSYTFENRRASDNAVIASGTITADAHGLVHLDNFQISRTGNFLILKPSGSPPVNHPPDAVASASPTSGQAPLVVQFSGSNSTDSDGTIVTYDWSFGDGGTASQANPQYTYNTAGSYSARLIVTDNAGAKDTAFVQIQVNAPANQPPNAVASANPTSGQAPLAVQFTGSSSTDSDGAIVSYDWSFGDGNTASQADPQHIYNTTGSYFARLIVTDNDGETDTAFVPIQVNAAGNQPPNAVAIANPTSGPAPLMVQFAGSNSTDSDGAVASHGWSFGDGVTASQANPQHTYNTAGVYTARLIVTDDDGATDTAFVQIQVNNSSPSNLPVIRVNAGGQQYVSTNGKTFLADQAYNPGSWGYTELGAIRTTASAITNTSDPALYQVQHEKSELNYRFDLPNGSYEMILHFAEINDDEAGKRVMDATVEGTLVVNDLDVWVTAGGEDKALTQVINAVAVNDGQLHLYMVRSTSSVKRPPAIAAIEIGPVGSLTGNQPLPNQPPAAIASANPTSGQAPLAVQFTGSNSTDSDGTIMSFDWSFGDGGTASQANPQHTYNATGSFSVRLIVTDDDGATDTTFVQIQVSSLPPLHQFALLADKIINFERFEKIEGEVFSNRDATFFAGKSGVLAGDLTAFRNVILDSANIIDGDLTAGGTATLDPDAIVTGTVTSGASVTKISLPIFTWGPFTGPVVQIPKGDSAVVAPGDFVRLRADSGAVMRLSSGTYNVNRFIINGSAKVKLDLSGGPVTINVADLLSFRPASQIIIESIAGSSEDIFINFKGIGAVECSKKSKLQGSLMAPNARVVLGNGAGFLGAISANRIDVKTNARVRHHSVAGGIPKTDEDETRAADGAIARDYALGQNYPNPFNPSTKIPFSLLEAGMVQLSVYNLQGQEVRALVSGQMNPGRHVITWNGRNNDGIIVPSGIYLYKLQVSRFEQTRKMTFMK